MVRRRILILESEQISSSGIKNLLSKQEGLHVQGTNFNSWLELLQVIDHFQPDVLVMYDDLLESVNLRLATFLKDFTGLRTIIVHYEDNEIEIYECQKVLIKEFADFLAVI